MFMVLAGLVHSSNAQQITEDLKQPDWGRIAVGPSRGRLDISVRDENRSEKLEIPTPFPNAVYFAYGTELERNFLDFEFNADATRMELKLPDEAFDPSQRIRAYIAEKSVPHEDGRIVFSALDAKVTGTTAKLESHPGNHRIGFWTNESDFVSWRHKASRWGMYEILLTYSSASPSGSLIEVSAGEADVTGAILSTGSWYRYRTISLGTIYWSKAGAKEIEVRCQKKVGGAVMNLKSVTLVPACEGKPPIQRDDGSILLHARDATVQGTMLRWEPNEKKQTLGYWVRQKDAGTWIFTVRDPGSFTVEVMQGCGTGQGGSEMSIRVGMERLFWTVEDTGHFQNFKVRQVGQLTVKTPGRYQLTVSPEKIAKNAACDIRQIRLVPIR